jgi:hypothetical protein
LYKFFLSLSAHMQKYMNYILFLQKLSFLSQFFNIFAIV